MGMFDTVRVESGGPMTEAVTERNWQCHLEDVGATFRITADMAFEKKVIRLKEGVELEDDEMPSPDQLEEAWVPADDEAYDGAITLQSDDMMMWDIVVESGEVVDADPSLVASV